MKAPASGIADELRALALGHPDVSESVACKGTPLESITYNRRNRAFLFLGRKGGFHVIRLKLRESEEDATKLAKQEPLRFDVGANGWAKLTFGEESAPRKLLEKWIEESYRAMGDPIPTKAKLATPKPKPKPKPAARIAKRKKR